MKVQVRSMSLRARLVVATCLVSLVALVAAGIATSTAFSHTQLGQIDDLMQRTHESIEQLVATESSESASGVDDDGPAGDADLERSIEQVAPGQLVAVLDPTGKRVVSLPARNPGHAPLSVDLARLTLPPRDDGSVVDRPTFTTVTADDGSTDIRLRLSRLADGSVLVIGLSLHEADESGRRLIAIEAIVAAISLVVAAVLAWMLVRVGLRPLRRVEQTALAIASGGDLAHEVPGGDRATEVGRLAAALNMMLGRIRGAFAERDAKEHALQDSEQKMRRFVADVSHELRTPLAAVTAYTELFERGARDHPDDLERALRGISLEAARMQELVEELLLLAHLDEGRPLELRRIDLVEVVVDSVGAARAVSPDWPISLRVSEIVTVDGDAGRLRQVMDNLLANVRTHTPPGTATAVSVGVEDGRASITVADDGPGMNQHEAERVFERFFRADPSRSRQSGGAGLGMAIVHALITAHHGDIRVDTAPGHGVRIIVTLPFPADPAPPTTRHDLGHPVPTGDETGR